MTWFPFRTQMHVRHDTDKAGSGPDHALLSCLLTAGWVFCVGEGEGAVQQIHSESVGFTVACVIRGGEASPQCRTQRRGDLAARP